LDKIIEVIGELKAQVRAFVDDLGPLEVTSGDLVSSLEQLAERTAARHDVVCQLHADQLVADLEAAVAQQLLYVAREAVHNAVKHGSGRHLSLSLRDSPGQIVLSVRDDGTGFIGGADNLSGRGMTIMRYRAGLIGAHLNVASRPGHGTVVRCVLPKRAGA
jgi:signal transduction histidine kinase